MKSRALWFMILGGLSFPAIANFGVSSADAATIVALGASNTYGKGVARNQAYPAQLEAILRAKGSSVHVVNAGINGDTTEGMLGRLDSAVPNGTSAVILQPGGNDRRKGRPDRTAEIQSRLAARHIPVIMLGKRHAERQAAPARRPASDPGGLPYARRAARFAGIRGDRPVARMERRSRRNSTLHGVVFEIFVWGPRGEAPGHVRVPDRWCFAFVVMDSQVFLARRRNSTVRRLPHPA